MNGASAVDRRPAFLFVGVAAVVYGVSIWIVQGYERLDGSGLVLAGVTLDLVLTVPVAYYFLVVRKYALNVLSVVPVAILGIVIANLVLPADHTGTLRVVELIVLPLELILIAVVGRRAYGAMRQLRSSRRDSDPVVAFRQSAAMLFGDSRIAEIVSSEVSCLYFALLSWRSESHVPDGAVAFRAHEKTGNSGIVLAAVLLVLVEIVPLHLLVARWSVTIAWGLTVASAYGLLLLIGDYRATVLRPILLNGRVLFVRAGLRWNAEIPITQIGGITRGAGDKGTSVLDVTIVGSATHWIILSAPIEVRGIYGIRRRVNRIGIQPDDPAAFEETITALLRP